MSLSAIIHKAEESGYWTKVLALPGCMTQGETMDEVIRDLREAVQGWLSVETPEGDVATSDRVIALPR